MYTPYYVSPNAYAIVNYLGHFLGQNLISRTNITATDSDKSKKCALAKRRENLSRTASYNNPGVSKSQPNPRVSGRATGYMKPSNLVWLVLN